MSDWEIVEEALRPERQDVDPVARHHQRKEADAALARLRAREQEWSDANAAWGTAAGEFSVRAEAAEAKAQELENKYEAASEALHIALDQAQELEAALREIAGQQQKVLAYIEANGFVFSDIGQEPGNWQHLAFSIYNDLCEVDVWARNALDEPIGAALEPRAPTPDHFEGNIGANIAGGYEPGETA